MTLVWGKNNTLFCVVFEKKKSLIFTKADLICKKINKGSKIVKYFLKCKNDCFVF